MIDGVARDTVVPVLLFVKTVSVLAKDHCRISFSELKILAWTKSSPVALKLMVKQSPTLIHLRHAKTFLCESLRGCTIVLNH